MLGDAGIQTGFSCDWWVGTMAGKSGAHGPEWDDYSGNRENASALGYLLGKEEDQA